MSSVIFGMLPKLYTEMLNGLHLHVNIEYIFCLTIIQQFNLNLNKIHLARSHHTQLDLLSFINEDYIAGYTQDGHMSTVRRFFCLFVAFDLFFISMLWFICIMVNRIKSLNFQTLNVVFKFNFFFFIFLDER